MHLLVFMKMQRPGWFMRFMVLAAQGMYKRTLAQW
jgi:hypothetical protein